MGIFDNIGRTLSDAGQATLQKGKDIKDIAKFNAMINEEEGKRRALYERIGKQYVEEFGDNPAPSLAELVDGIRDADCNIAEYQDHIMELKGGARCPNCGAEVVAGNLYCTNCGTKIEIHTEAHVTGTTRHCTACGAELAEGSKFCTSCGEPVKDAEAMHNTDHMHSYEHPHDHERATDSDPVDGNTPTSNTEPMKNNDSIMASAFMNDSEPMMHSESEHPHMDATQDPQTSHNDSSTYEQAER